MSNLLRGTAVLVPDAEAQSRLDAGALDGGDLQVVHADFYRQFEQEQLSTFAHRIGAYCLPTHELLDKINELILEASPSRSAIEIGAGNGTIGRALGIPCTDNFMQDRPEVKAIYQSMGQPCVQYGEHVQRLSALDAVKHCRPEVVVAAWVTHLYNPDESFRGGNAMGIDEVAMLKQIKRYVFVGHNSPHALKPLLDTTYKRIALDGLFSRSTDPTGNAIWVWDNPDY